MNLCLTKHLLNMLRRFFLGISPLKCEKQTPTQASAFATFHRVNLTLASCSSAELDSVSVQNKFQIKKLYLQTVEKADHFHLDFSDEEQEEVENDYTDYHEVEKWTSTEAFEIMSDFANQLTDTDLQDQLLEALSKKKPFREFKFIIDDSNEFRQEWFDFKSKCQQDFVKRQLNTLQP